MADISTEIAAIGAAKYGEEVRGAIQTALTAMNVETNNAEKWATGAGTVDPGSGSTPGTENNAKYYAQTAEAAAESIPQDYSELANSVDEMEAVIDVRYVGVPKDIETGGYSGAVGSVISTDSSSSWRRANIKTGLAKRYRIYHRTVGYDGNVTYGWMCDENDVILSVYQVNDPNGGNLVYGYMDVPEGAVKLYMRSYTTSASYIKIAAIYDLTDTNDALTNLAPTVPDTVKTSFVSGSITNGGTANTSSTNTIRTETPFKITAGMFWEVDPLYRASVAVYESAEFSESSFIGFVGTDNSALYAGTIFIPADMVGKYMAIRIRKYGHTSDDISGEVATIGNYVKLHDRSTVATDAKIQDSLQDRATTYLPYRNASSFVWEIGKSIRSNGSEADSDLGATTLMLPIRGGETIVNESASADNSDKPLYLFVSEYKAGTFQKRTAVGSGNAYTFAEDSDGLRLSYMYTSDNPETMSGERLKTYFGVRLMANIAPGDGQRLVYAAFGASTTIGAIHHYTGISTTRSPYAFPNYIGQILGLETYNLAHGTTGFMARDDGKQPNFMDMIYGSSEILSRANLITIMFGYGNDKTRGLPFGSWDDYYPYDEEEYFYTEGDTVGNEAGVTAMLAGGATLMGCLNWCIKWIGEHYPKAILVCLFGAPSLNHEYPVTVVANSDPSAGTTGVSPQKITVTVADSNPPTPKPETSTNGTTVNTLRQKLNIPIINLAEEAMPFSYYSSVATEQDGTYSIFSTAGTQANPKWNSHPNDAGYLMYARFLAGKISEYFHH